MPKRVSVYLALLLVSGSVACGPAGVPGNSVGRPSPVSTSLPRVGSGTPVRPPASGIYTFTVTEKNPGSHGQQAQQTSEHSDEIQEPSEIAPGVFLQRVWHLQNSRRPYNVDLVWRPDATYSMSQQFRESGLCVFGPPLLARRLPLKVGLEWSIKSFCANDQPPRRKVTGLNRVVRTEELLIGGDKVSTMVIEYTLSLEGFGGEGPITYRGTEWYSPTHRLDVKQLIRYSYPNAPAGEYTEELKSLQPVPLASRGPWPATSS